jgi:hypothetical protein
MQTDKQRLFQKALALTVLLTCLGVLSHKAQKAFTTYAGQRAIQLPNISVVPQPTSPLRISSARFEGANQEQHDIVFNITNIGGEPVSAYALRQDVSAGGKSRSSVLLFDLGLTDSVLSPRQSVTRADTFQPLADEPNTLSISIDYVEFSDGTKWGPDTFRSAEQVAGQREGARQAIKRLGEILNTSGPRAVLDTVNSEAVSASPPAGHSVRWVEGFHKGSEVTSARLKNAFKKGGLGEVERVLKQSLTLRKGVD